MSPRKNSGEKPAASDVTPADEAVVETEPTTASDVPTDYPDELPVEGIGHKVKPGDLVLDVDDLHVDFYVEGEWVPAAIELTYQVKAGEVLAIVGESGSGKTQSSMAMLGLLPRNGRHYGSAKLNGTELVGMSQRALSKVRGPQVGVIFQEPMTAMNPVYTVGFQIVETLRQHTDLNPSDAKARAIELLTEAQVQFPE